MRLLVVIVSYKVTDLTLDCLASLQEEIPAIPGARVAVCENGTGAEDLQRIRAAISAGGWDGWASVTSVHPNRGFTGGNNVILDPVLREQDPPTYCLLLNADTIVRPGAIQALVSFMDDHPEVGIAGSRLEYPDGEPQVSAFRFHHFLGEFGRGLRLGVASRWLQPWMTVRPIPDAACVADWVSGASMIIRREVFDAIGTLDEGYYTYFDDIDFCWNAKKAGWPAWYVPKSRVVHLMGKTTGISSDRKEKRRAAYWFQARRRYFLKNHGWLQAALADAGFIAGFALWRLRRFVTRKPDTDPAHFLWDSIRHSVFLTGFRLREVRNPLL